MGSGGEFEFIRTRLGPLTRNHEAALGLADDAAVLDPPPGCQLVLACDTLVAGVHFRTGDAPAVAAARAMRSNLSDMAAMGADPLGYLSALTWPQDGDAAWRDAFVTGLASEQALFGLPLLGGDTTATPGPMTVTLTLIGSVPAGTALLRSGARAGDDIWVSGTIGDAALGLAALAGEAGAPEALTDRYARPSPRLDLGRGLRGLATAAIDVSDGLSPMRAISPRPAGWPSRSRRRRCRCPLRRAPGSRGRARATCRASSAGATTTNSCSPRRRTGARRSLRLPGRTCR